MPEERSPEELAAEAEGMTHADMGPPQEELSSPDEGEFLEETLLPSTVENATLEPGSTHTWGSLTFRVEGPFWGGWMAALQDGQGLLVRPGYKAELLEGLGHHRLLPRLVYSGPEGTALEALEGEPLYRPLPLSVALGVVQPLAQLVYFLELKGLALVDLEPQSLRQTPEGPKLALPPRLARLGEPPPKVWRPGYTPPEVLAETTLSGKSGVYLLGALLFELLTGSPLPAEGPSELLLSGLRPPGLPQALARMLAPAEVRATPQEALGLLKRLAQPRGVGVVLELGEATTVGLNPGRQPQPRRLRLPKLERVQSEFGLHPFAPGLRLRWDGGMAAGERASQAAAEGFIAGEPPPPRRPEGPGRVGVRLAWAANQAVLEALGGWTGVAH